MSWQFTKIGNTVTFHDPVKGYQAVETKAQALARTAAGSVRVYDKNLSRFQTRVSWEGLADTEKAGLTTFFDNADDDSPAGVDGMAETFTLTDDDGATYTARFVEPDLRFTKSVNNRWDLTVTLETDAVITG